MNIFVLDADPRQAARDQCNRHVVKMVIESAQLLCTALATNGTPVDRLPYRPTHAHHPSTVWTAASPHNMAWLMEHALELSDEYTRRYGNVHATQRALDAVMPFLPSGGDWRQHTPFVQAMPEQWRGPDAVVAYRDYYVADKARFAKWVPRAVPPVWWPYIEKET